MKEPLARSYSGLTPCAVCGHPASEHYTYVRNGEDVERCRMCDPTAGWPGGAYELTPEIAALDAAADHPFRPVEVC